MLRIERLRAKEASRLRAIRLRALLDAPDAFASTFEETATRSDEYWSQALVDLPAFVAVEDGTDVGIVRCAFHETRIDTAWLISMWVAGDLRRKGVGGALVDVVIGWARSNGVNRLLLDVADNNSPAIALYQRKGFQPNGEVSVFPPPREHIREHQRELQISRTQNAD